MERIVNWSTFALLMLLSLASSCLHAQPDTDTQLATHYLQSGDLEKAAIYYERLYDRTPSVFNYEQLLKCYTGLKDYNKAEKLVKGHQKKQRNDPRFTVDLGTLYALMGNDDDARKEYEKALKELTPDVTRIRQVANAFTKNNEIDLALEAYHRGDKLLKGSYNFHYEIANLHGMKGDMASMINEYMDLLTANEGYIQTVQNSLGRFIDFERADDRSEVLRTELLRRIQRDPNSTIFADLLIWTYIQQKDLYAAMVQSKALDKRSNEGGIRLMDLARIAAGNDDFGVATKCYQYVVDLGPSSPNYLGARIGLIKALDAKVRKEGATDREEVKRLEANYATALSELGRNANTVELIRGLASLKAYHLRDVQGGMTLLEDALSMALDNETKARIKLELGDLHVLNDDIWEASLLFSQVDLDFKHDMLGHEARYRNARVSYYAGDFLWAQAQLDVLKASTSKLIANDAMELSLLITDNLGLDSNSVPLQTFALSELLVFQHRYNDAEELLDSLEHFYPMHALGDNVLMARSRIAMAEGRYTDAVAHLNELLELYAQDILADNALFELGKLFEERLNDPEKAKGYYERLLFDHPGSIFVVQARERYRRLRGDHSPDTMPKDPAPLQEAP